MQLIINHSEMQEIESSLVVVVYKDFSQRNNITTPWRKTMSLVDEHSNHSKIRRLRSLVSQIRCKCHLYLPVASFITGEGSDKRLGRATNNCP